ncbi:MAG: GTPase [Oscillospiraceae bacterium]
MSDCINISKIGNGKELRSTLERIAAEGLISKTQYSEIASKLDKLVDDLSHKPGKAFRVTCAGVYNSGKSSLLNALTDSEHFQVGDVPTTATIDELTVDGLTYVDTPGLNANDMDNATAVKAFKDADLIIFVSNIINGGLNSAEAKYLTALSEILGGKDNLRRQTLFVMSNLHQTSDEQAPEISAEHRSNIEKTFGFAPEDIMLYDAVTYKTGVSSKQKALINASGIPALKKRISECAKAVAGSTAEITGDRISSSEAALSESLSALLEGLKKKLPKADAVLDKAAVKAAEKKCEQLINDTISAIEPITPLGGMDMLLNPINHGLSPFRGESSEYAAKRRIRDKLSSAYNRRESVLRDAASRVAEIIMSYNEYRRTDGNYYHNINRRAANAILECNRMFKEVGISLPTSAIADIEVVPTLCNTSQRELRDIITEDVIEYSGYYSLDSYTDYCDVEEECAGTGLFGRDKYTYGCYNLYRAADEMIKDMKSSFNSNVNSAWRQTVSNSQAFCNKVKAELEARKSAIIQAAESALVRSADDKGNETLKKAVADLEGFFRG